MKRHLFSPTLHAMGFPKCHTVVYMWYVSAVHMWSYVVFCPFACFLQSSSVLNSLTHRGFSVFWCPEGHLYWVVPLCGQVFYVLNKLCLLIHSSVNYQPYCGREDGLCFYLSEGLSILLLFHITSNLKFFTNIKIKYCLHSSAIHVSKWVWWEFEWKNMKSSCERIKLMLHFGNITNTTIQSVQIRQYCCL